MANMEIKLAFRIKIVKQNVIGPLQEEVDKKGITTNDSHSSIHYSCSRHIMLSEPIKVQEY